MGQDNHIVRDIKYIASDPVYEEEVAKPYKVGNIDVMDFLKYPVATWCVTQIEHVMKTLPNGDEFNEFIKTECYTTAGAMRSSDFKEIVLPSLQKWLIHKNIDNMSLAKFLVIWMYIKTFPQTDDDSSDNQFNLEFCFHPKFLATMDDLFVMS